MARVRDRWGFCSLLSPLADLVGRQLSGGLLSRASAGAQLGKSTPFVKRALGLPSAPRPGLGAAAMAVHRTRSRPLRDFRFSGEHTVGAKDVRWRKSRCFVKGH